MVAHVIGRWTGEHFPQLMSCDSDGPALLTPGGGRWTLLLGNGQPVLLRICGWDVGARPDLVRDSETLISRPPSLCDPGQSRGPTGLIAVAYCAGAKAETELDRHGWLPAVPRARDCVHLA